MKRFIISLDDEMYEKMEKHCDELHYTKSEYVRSLIRKELFKEAIFPGIAKAEKEVSRENIPSERVSSEKVRKLMYPLDKAPRFCKKHNASRIGDHFTCGCPVK